MASQDRASHAAHTGAEAPILRPEEALVAAESGGGTPTPKPPVQHIERGTKAFRLTVFSMFTAGFSTFALLYSVQPLMPVVAKSFLLSAAQSSLILSVATIGLSLGLLFTGPLSDALGRKNIMVTALLFASAATLTASLMPSWHGVLALRAVVGLSLSGLVAVAMTYLSEEIHPKDLGFAMGLYIGGNAIGGMFGRLIAGVMVDFVSWRAAVGTLGALGLCAALVFWRIAPASRNFSPTPHRIGALAEGYAIHFRDAALPWLFLEGFLLMGGFVTFFNYLSYRLLAAPFNLSQAVVGSVSAVYVSGIYSSPKIGALADRLGRRRVLWAVTTVMLVGALITASSSLWLILIGMLVFSFGFFGAHSVASSWIGRRARRARGQASSMYLLSYYIGGSLAGTAGGYFWHAWGWDGIVWFIGSLLACAVAVSLRLLRVAPLPQV